MDDELDDLSLCEQFGYKFENEFETWEEFAIGSPPSEFLDHLDPKNSFLEVAGIEVSWPQFYASDLKPSSLQEKHESGWRKFQKYLEIAESSGASVSDGKVKITAALTRAMLEYVSLYWEVTTSFAILLRDSNADFDYNSLDGPDDQGFHFDIQKDFPKTNKLWDIFQDRYADRLPKIYQSDSTESDVIGFFTDCMIFRVDTVVSRLRESFPHILAAVADHCCNQKLAKCGESLTSIVRSIEKDETPTDGQIAAFYKAIHSESLQDTLIKES